MQQERLNYLKSRHPNFRLGFGKPKISKERIIKKTNLGLLNYNGGKGIDLNDMVKRLKAFNAKYPQFKDIQVAIFNDGNEVELTVSGYMKELDTDYNIRVQSEKEQLELYELMSEEKKQKDREDRRRRFLELKEEFEEGKIVDDNDDVKPREGYSRFFDNPIYMAFPNEEENEVKW